ncbi:MAG: exodeoxyribonuclease VII small subunit [Ignavibacteriaceae bacterium]|jgi:Exonuclease VII small subunit.|nr:MAG: exodeoxyribonuclease VII small subunit [Chlorobiota bacterium]KXK03684.1 MAG: Exodeoxyribonuclease 7 small subunit [Chlorobi bacterium OLB4]MBV6398922.1 Exodeoxyribonuclease 7 small subunit [Ignavibacteria bacterium]MCC6886239.1 exodeoxyribonuclease VII small subunit [Ignavibacteriales bacterium]MCE7952307.1 exodeoxyribonuclease VII small subunit [Chlorobi bacterium CHB7]MEB2328888.1 exodeoxyribonuclease VII small subunit [Ignavibacteriaceae bacterium]OQY77054.1 MAG: exodeoxyribonucle
MAKRRSSKKGTFEESYTKLEEIVQNLENESESISISDLIENYKEGLMLLKICRTKLKEAELQITKIKNDDE